MQKYSGEEKARIEKRVAQLYAEGHRKKGIHQAMVDEGFNNPEGDKPINIHFINNSMTKMKKDGKLSGVPVVDEALEEDVELVDLPQIVIDLLVSEELVAQQKVDMVKTYYQL